MKLLKLFALISFILIINNQTFTMEKPSIDDGIRSDTVFKTWTYLEDGVIRVTYYKYAPSHAILHIVDRRAENNDNCDSINTTIKALTAILGAAETEEPFISATGGVRSSLDKGSKK